MPFSTDSPTVAFSGGATKAQYGFAQVPSVEMERSVFNRSHSHKTTFDSGLLIPIFADEALPGDTMNMKLTAFARMATPIHPVMDNIFLDIFFFSCPNRILWDNWERFNGAQDDPGDSIAFTVPQFTGVTVAEGSLSDYFGLPLQSSLDFNSLHHRAYNLIFKEWFRSQDLTDSPVVDKGNGPDTLSNYVVRRRTKRHDYFSSCLPWPTKGGGLSGTPEPAMLVTSLGLGGGTGLPTFSDGTNVNSLEKVGDTKVSHLPSDTGDLQWVDPQLEVLVSGMRLAVQTQRLLERDARGGTRYVEILQSHFGVRDPGQAVLNRPEYLGGGTVRINVHTVPNTNFPLGNLGGFGTALAGVGFVKSFTEHSVVIGLANVRADISYQQGMERMWSRQTRYDFFWPVFSHLGEQSVLNKEIFATGIPAGDDLTFGFNERWAEYRYKPSRVSGAFRSGAATPLDSWHLALNFSVLPVLNNTFIEDLPPVNRVVQTPTEPEFLFDGWFDYRHARPMPTYSVPGMIDHF